MFQALALYLPAFNTAQSRAPIDFTIVCVLVCMRGCVVLMTSEVCRIDFR